MDETRSQTNLGTSGGIGQPRWRDDNELGHQALQQPRGRTGKKQLKPPMCAPDDTIFAI